MKYKPQFVPPSEPIAAFSLLDTNGKLKKGARAPLSDTQTLAALRAMMLGRIFDEKSFSLQRQGRIGTFAPIVGQEASILGPALALDPARDWVVPQYREAPALFHQGFPVERMALYRLGQRAGANIPEGVKILPHQISLAAQIPHAVGLGWGLKLQGKDGVVAVYFGDGASSERDFHEACNLAGITKAPVLFVLQDNGWAISTPRALQTAGTDFASRAQGYGFPGVAVDGNDLFALYVVAAEAVARGRAGEGPTLIESRTYRMGAHTTADDPTRYVDPKIRDKWKAKDPIERVQKYLAGKGKWDDAIGENMREEVTAEVEQAYEKAFAYPEPEASDLFEEVFAERSPLLERQRHLASQAS
ncbi:MAG: thiamine pyrophosphate-dependent enzyme [Proteobacteria bacterium]|nr:thiamine pyrophosphate-dependent enzyme [Pseudomonadota bacterium]